MKTKPIAGNQEVKRHPNNNISLCQFLGTSRRWVKESSCQLLWLPFHLEKQNKLERDWLQPSRTDWISLCQESLHQIPPSFLSSHLWKFTLAQSDTPGYQGKLSGETPKTSTLLRTGAMYKQELWPDTNMHRGAIFRSKRNWTSLIKRTCSSARGWENSEAIYPKEKRKWSHVGFASNCWTYLKPQIVVSTVR